MVLDRISIDYLSSRNTVISQFTFFGLVFIQDINADREFLIKNESHLLQRTECCHVAQAWTNRQSQIRPLQEKKTTNYSIEIHPSAVMFFTANQSLALKQTAANFVGHEQF